MAHLDYKAMAAKLPTGKTPEQKEERSKMFKLFDPNGNGFLSLAEIDKGIRDVLEMDDLFHCKPAIMRAYTAAKAVYKGGKSGRDDDYVSRIEFRLLLVYLKEYFLLHDIFKTIDTGGDHKIGVPEFKDAVPLLRERGIHIDNAEAAFREIDA